MPYAAPVKGLAFSPSKQNRGWPFPTTKSIGSKKAYDDLDVNAKDLIDRDNALKEVKDILSTSPQLSTSPRRKSAPESRKPFLKVDLPALPLPEIPCILRKKSGEIVKSSLKKGCSKSEPVTPTFPKYVHFNADLEQIKLFNEAQRPQAVSADVSSDEDSDDDNVFDDNLLGFSASDDEDNDDYIEESELVISLPNRPVMTTMHSSKPVFVESIYLSQDKRKLQGRIMVQNFAFQKTVTVRYTFDFWSTVSEASATFAEGITSKDNKNSFDAFIFSIELIDNSRNPIDGKTMYFAVHYSVENGDFWDNNNGSNYQVNFKKITPPPSSKYSNNKKKNNQNTITTSTTSSSKWAMSSMSRQSTKNLNETLCRSPPTLEPSTKLNVEDVRKKVMGRYDIGVSLSAAQNAQKSSAPRTPTDDYNTRTFQFFTPVPYSNYGTQFGTSDFPISHSPGFGQLKNSNPIAIPSSKPDIGSTSYDVLVNKYCFYSGSPYTTNSPITTGSPPVMT
ncbi:carbohydrate-binding module family 21 protein [Rhizophagus clarus]|uniref:Carbohydrate-binding module family 21 protein n=1 Tax=Rhizophagus clarus TaxID=94130 RepID=A0A8H3L1H2_9GLOM|nr:carbohydrate-binding module family 21 protein [Rhizophagus clarus]